MYIKQVLKNDGTYFVNTDQGPFVDKLRTYKQMVLHCACMSAIHEDKRAVATNHRDRMYHARLKGRYETRRIKWLLLSVKKVTT